MQSVFVACFICTHYVSKEISVITLCSLLGEVMLGGGSAHEHTQILPLSSVPCPSSVFCLTHLGEKGSSCPGVWADPLEDPFGSRDQPC